MTATTEATIVPEASSAANSEVKSPTEASKASGGLDLTKGSNLLVNYIPRSITNTDLERLFSPFGAIEKARCITDRLTGACQGYGFVQFKTTQSAAEAVLHFSEHPPPEGSAMKVSFARPAESHKLSNLHVTGLPVAYTEDDFKNLFEQYGEVCEVTLLKTPSGESRGSGFIRLETPSQAQAAVNALHDSIPPRGSSRLTVRFASGTKREAMNRVSGRGGPNYGRPYPPIPPIHAPPPLPPIAPYYGGDAYNPVAGYGHSAVSVYPAQSQPYSNYSYGGSYNPHVAALEAQLQSAIESQQYEKCASIRDQIQALMASSTADPTYSAYATRVPATNAGAYSTSTPSSTTSYPPASAPANAYATSPATSNVYAAGTSVSNSTYASNVSAAAAYATGSNSAAATYSGYGAASASGYGPERSKSSRSSAASAPSPYGQYGQPAPPPPAPAQQGSSSSYVLYVAGLPYDYDEQTLVMMFGQFGQVTNVKIPRDPATRMPKGYAFVTMPTQEAGAAAIIALNGYSLGSRTLQNPARDYLELLVVAFPNAFLSIIFLLLLLIFKILSDLIGILLIENIPSLHVSLGF